MIHLNKECIHHLNSHCHCKMASYVALLHVHEYLRTHSAGNGKSLPKTQIEIVTSEQQNIYSS